MGKMVRRARAMGLISKFSDRPAVGGYGSTASGRGLTFARRSYE